MLAAEGWDLAKLAGAQVEDLVPYPGVGKATAAKLIAEANRLWNAS
jgi:DNA uptake protein ComE-like DNA-binding protein